MINLMLHLIVTQTVEVQDWSTITHHLQRRSFRNQIR